MYNTVAIHLSLCFNCLIKKWMAANTPSPKLLDPVRDLIRAKHYSIRTENQYLQWIRRFILFHGKQHTREMRAPEVEAFLSYWLFPAMWPLQRRIRPYQHCCLCIAKCWVSICLGWIILLAPSGLNACRWYFRAMRCERCWSGYRVFMV